MLKVLDLFSGIGGFSRGFEATGFFETISFVENESYCQAVLKHHWPEVPILGDITDVRGSDLPTRPDVICGGFPCQPFSQAGKQQAQDDARHLWPEMFRLIRECRPTWVVGENVAGLIRLGLDEVLTDLESEGYSTRTFNIPACSVGAPHLRQRLWIVAHSDSESEPDVSFDGNARQRQLGFDFVADPNNTRNRASECKVNRDGTKIDEGQAEQPQSQFSRLGKDVANSKRTGTGVEEHRSSGQGRKSPDSSQPEVLRQNDRTSSSKGSSAGGEDVADSDRDDRGRGRSTKSSGRKSRMEHWSGGECNRFEDWWEVEPSVGRLVNGLPNRVPQLRALGNSIVPQIAQKIGQAIKETYNVYKRRV